MVKQKRLQTYLSTVIDRKLLSHAYLISGAKGSGKEELVDWVTQKIFCTDDAVTPCQQCATCRRIAEKQFGDVMVIEPDGATIKVEQIRSLKADGAFSSLESNCKIYVIKQAELMSVSAANSLLKLIEEPDGQMHFFLLTENKEKVLPTILSRTQLLHCDRILKNDIQSQLMANGYSVLDSYLLAHVTNDVTDALRLKDEGVCELLEQIVAFGKTLIKRDSRSFTMVQRYLIPVLHNREFAKIGLECLLVIINDALKSKRLSNYATPLAIESSSVSITVDAIDTVLTAIRYLQSNVAVQSCYEYLALQLSK